MHHIHTEHCMIITHYHHVHLTIFTTFFKTQYG